MPEITIKMYVGRTSAQKEEIVEVFTRELSRIIQREPEFITISFNEIAVDKHAPPHLLTAAAKGGNEHDSE